jgi:signal transduction histidine kinase/CheY-like chemotaxis protein
MSMNLTIKEKLFAGYGIMLLMLAGLALFMLNKFSEANDRFLNVVNKSSRKVNLSNELLVAVLNQSRYEKNLILVNGQAEIVYFNNKLNEAIESVDKKTAELELMLDGPGKEQLNEVKAAWTAYKPQLHKLISYAIKNDREKATAISTETDLKMRNIFFGVVQKLIQKNEEQMEKDKIQNQEGYVTSTSLVFLLIAAGFVIAFLLSYWIITSISKRISFIAKEAEKISSRENTTERLKDDTRDELKPIFDSLININESFRDIAENANKVAEGNYSIDLVPRSDKDTLGNALKKMTGSLRDTTAANRKHNWLTNGQNQLNEKLRGDQTEIRLAENIITFLANYLDANIGVVYLLDEHTRILQLSAQYAFSSSLLTKEKFSLNEGLIGQAAIEQRQISISDVQEEDIRIASAVLNARPKHILIIPFLFEGKTLGVIEIGKRVVFTEMEREFIDSIIENIGIGINLSISRKQIKQLLNETQVQSIELRSQQEELKQMNEELEEQAQSLKQQQEELQVTNEELEEQTQALEMKNKDVEAAKYDIEQKTKQLEISTRYKSEFLANMSHELRTPLNSLLILSKDLSENKKKNLFPDQVESADIIYKSGHDLLVLINEVLDLSKIEAGKMSVNAERIDLKNFCSLLMRDFKRNADQKDISLHCNVENDCPEAIHTDSQRLHQILKNLLSNAIKFTEKGKVNVDIRKYSDRLLNFSVTDTGIGVPEDKQAAIFEAFQQADGGTSRKYGGTGLGLSISRELAKLLGGEIQLQSRVNEGSTFSLLIPMEINNNEEVPVLSQYKGTGAERFIEKKTEFINYPSIEDDRYRINEDDKLVLIIEDDPKFASILLRQSNSQGFKGIAAATGEDGLICVERYKPHAIILDLHLPGISGHQVLGELKSNPLLRHIPVHVISADEQFMKPVQEGAVECLVKPLDKMQLEKAFGRIENFVSRKMKNLLIIEDDENSRQAMKQLIGNGDVKCYEASTGKKALEIYKENHIDCIVLDLGLKDMNGFDVIYELKKTTAGAVPPIVVYTGRELTKEENSELQKYTQTVIIKGVRSEERLLDETALFLHRTISNLPHSKQQIIHTLYDKDVVFQGKRILLVDDDMRNIFALSKILKERGMIVIKAENGKEALKILDQDTEIDLILMDIMMPELDGYETMKRIRLHKTYKSVTIIALTAKAMKDDKEKCMYAGATDYITKPVDTTRLISLMHVWLSK